MRNAKLLLINTLILTLGSFIMRTITVSFNVYLTNEIGSSGIGLLQLVMAVYGLVITFAGAGVKLGATRLVTDAITSGKNSVQQIMSICFRYSLAVGIGVCIVLYLFSGMISKEWIGDLRTESSLKILALSLPPISVSAALNGYFTAKKTMLKYSVVQLSEQLIKIIITVVSLKLFGNTGLSYACCAIAAGITAAEISSAFIAYIIYRKGNNKQNNHTEKQSILKRLLHICVPDVTGAGFRSILLTIEHLLIPQGFKKSGQSNEQAMSIYGTIHAMALPIVLYPSAVLTSLSSLLVPELSRYKLFNDTKKIGFAASTAIKITLIFSIAVATFMCFFSDNISTAIYSDLQASFYIKLLSVLIPVMYTDMITDGLLKGLDQQSASMRYNIFDSAICVVLVYFLLPKYSIKGYIFILFLSEIINFALSMNRLVKTAQLKLSITNDMLKPLLCSFLSCSVIRIFAERSALFESSAKFSLIICGVFCAVICSIGIYMSGSITKQEIKTYYNMLKNNSCT